MNIYNLEVAFKKELLNKKMASCQKGEKMPAITETFDNIVTLPLGTAESNVKESLELPVRISIRLLNSSTPLKAFVRLEYCGFYLNDIRIYERRGSTDIVYPEKTISKNGFDKKTSIFHPYIADLGTQLNRIIVNAYTEAALKHYSMIEPCAA